MKINKIKKVKFFKLRIGLFGRIIFIFILPIFFTVIMFNPLLKIEIQSTSNGPQYISFAKINEDFSNFFLSEFFQTSLRLGWYKICFENQGSMLNMSGRTVEPIFDDRGSAEIQYKPILSGSLESDFKTLSAKPFEKPTCDLIGGDIQGLIIGTSTVNIGAFINDLPGDYNQIGENEFQKCWNQDFTKFIIFLKHDWRAYMAKYFVILIFWASFVLLIIGLKNFFTQK